MLNDKIKITNAVESEGNVPVQTDAMSDTTSFLSQTSPNQGHNLLPSALDFQQPQIEELEGEVSRLKGENSEFKHRLQTLETSYEILLIELAAIQRGMGQQDNLLRSILSRILGNRDSNASSESVLAPECYPLASAIEHSPILLPGLEAKPFPLTLSVRQNPSPSLLSQPSSPDSNDSDVSIIGSTSGPLAGCNPVLDFMVDSGDGPGVFEGIYCGFGGSSSPGEQRPDMKNEAFTAASLPIFSSPV